MKIAIIGTNGFLGTAIAKYALKKGWQLDMYGLVKPQTHSYNNFYLLDLCYDVIDVDLLCTNDIIIYAAGAGIQSNLDESSELMYQLNVIIPIRMCKAFHNCNYKGVFVTFGSYFELGQTNISKPATEYDVITAQTIAPTDYVASKRMYTRYISSYKHCFTSWHFILPTIFGVGENPKRLIPYTINAIRNNEKLRFTSGEQIRQYLYVDDVAECINKAYSSNLPSGVYNISGTCTISVRDLVDTICKKLDYNLDSYAFGSESKSDTSMKYLALDGSILKKYLKYEPKTTVDEVLRMYL